MTNLLKCADVEMALGYTGEAASKRHSTAAYSSPSPRGTVAGAIELNPFVQQRGIPGSGQETSEQLKFLLARLKEVTLLKE